MKFPQKTIDRDSSLEDEFDDLIVDSCDLKPSNPCEYPFDSQTKSCGKISLYRGNNDFFVCEKHYKKMQRHNDGLFTFKITGLPREVFGCEMPVGWLLR